MDSPPSSRTQMVRPQRRHAEGASLHCAALLCATRPHATPPWSLSVAAATRLDSTAGHGQLHARAIPLQGGSAPRAYMLCQASWRLRIFPPPCDRAPPWSPRECWDRR